MTKTIATHNGHFHADDIFSVAALKIVLGDVKVVRTRDMDLINKADYVVDVGAIYDPNENRFDHHQEGGAGERENGIPYASFGLVWKRFGEDICGSNDISESIDNGFVSVIDAQDNGIKVSEDLYENLHVPTIGDIFSLFEPTWQEKDSATDEEFIYLVDLAQLILERLIKFKKAKIDSYKEVRNAHDISEDKRLIVLDKNYLWKDYARSNEEVMFVIAPDSATGNWGARAVESEPFSFNVKLKFPEDWRGKRDKELENITGIEGSVFVHNAGFIAVADSKEGAIKMAKKALEQQ